jgi:hypothetical protein
MIRFCAGLGDDALQNDFMVFSELLQQVRDDLLRARHVELAAGLHEVALRVHVPLENAGRNIAMRIKRWGQRAPWSRSCHDQRNDGMLSHGKVLNGLSTKRLFPRPFYPQILL